MGSIKQLTKDLVNKIAAGEVIERPASVAKELIENSLDAGADKIRVSIEDGGRRRISVSDNGAGMEREDALLSVRSHSTSKISSVDELFAVTTLGFRGEALASIASVSTLEITTTPAGAQAGLWLRVEDGTVAEEKKVGASQGTTITVHELFHNTPARKKHLKARQTEVGHISDIVTRYALSHPELSIILESDGRELINCPASGGLINKVVYLYGKETAKHMLPVEYSDDMVRISGLVSKPYLARQDKSYQTLFVNGRYVKNQSVSEAVYDAYHTLLFLDRNPVYVLSIELDCTKTDVNVHPSKDIIRIEQEEQLYQSVFAAMRKTLTEQDLIPEVELDEEPPAAQPTQQYKLQSEKQTLLESGSTYSASQEQEQEQEEQTTLATDDRTRRIGPVKVLGQLGLLYVVCESPKGMLVLDQHAGQERVLFERFMSQVHEQEVARQRLIQPRLIEVSQAEATFMEENLELFRRTGFELDAYGPQTFKIREIPALFANYPRAVVDMLRELASSATQKTMQALSEEQVAQRACRAAVKAGEALTEPQIYQLIEQMEQCEKPYSCPHGRPTMITITLAELEKKFKRTGG